MFDSDAIEAARERDGQPGDLDSDVQAFLESLGTEEVAWEGDSDDLWNHENHEPFRKLAHADHTTDASDVADAIPGSTERQVRKLLRAHGIDITGPQVAESEVVELPKGVEVEPEYLATPIYSDARVSHHLLVTCQLGVGQAADVLTDVRRKLNPSANAVSYQVSASDLRAAAEDCGILSGPGSTEHRTDTNRPESEDRFDVTNQGRDTPQDVGPMEIEVGEADGWGGGGNYPE